MILCSSHIAQVPIVQLQALIQLMRILIVIDPGHVEAADPAFNAMHCVALSSSSSASSSHLGQYAGYQRVFAFLAVIISDRCVCFLESPFLRSNSVNGEHCFDKLELSAALTQQQACGGFLMVNRDMS